MRIRQLGFILPPVANAGKSTGEFITPWFPHILGFHVSGAADFGLVKGVSDRCNDTILSAFCLRA